MTQTVALGEIALSLQDGPFGSNLKSSHYVDRGVRVIRLQNIGVGHFDDRDRAFVSSEHFAGLRRHDCLPGDVLIATLGDPIIRSCLQPPWLEIALNKADCLRLRCDPRQAVPEYVVHFLNSGAARAQARNLAHGQTRARVNLGQVRSLRVPLPPLDEQRRIARILDIVSAAERRRSRSLSLIDDLLLGRFEQMFGNGSGAEWEHVPVRQFVGSFSGGKSFAGEDEDDQASPNRVLRVSAVTSGRFRPEQSRPVPRTYVPPADHYVRQGDLLISRANTSELVGAVALVESPIDGLLMPDKIWRFVWREQTAVVPEFIWQLFRTRAVRTAIQRRSTGTSGSMKNISAEKLMGLEVIWPPAELQHEFGHFYKTMTPLRDQVRSHLAQIGVLRASLGGSAFSGKI